MRKKELSPKQLLRMQRRAIQYRKRVRSRCLRASGLCRTATPKRRIPRLLKHRLQKLAEPCCKRIARLLPKVKTLLRALTRLKPKLKHLWERTRAILPRLTRMMKKLWKLLLFLQIPCRILILILESLPQRIRRADWTPCEGN